MNSHLKIGIVGLPNVGKSTLFRAITKKQVDCANYPFCTIEPNVGIVAVPDERVDKLAELSKSAKKIYATIEFVDIAGLVEGAHKGEGLGNKFLSHIREVDAVVYVLRAFENTDVVNVNQNIDPWRDKEILDTELILKDMEMINKVVGKLQKDSKSGDKEIIKELGIMSKAKEALDKGLVLSEQDFSEQEKNVLNKYQLLAMKPRLYLLNSNQKVQDGGFPSSVNKNNTVKFDIVAEAEAGDFSAKERMVMGMKEESGLDILIKKSYDLLGLINFLTTGEDETRAWTIKKGFKAPQAGGVIHSDFENKFVKTEVVGWQELLVCGGYAKAREKGLVRTEGKEYVVRDGDVIIFKHG